MALKAVLSTKAEVDLLPEAVRGFYVEQNGHFVLPVEGMVPETEASGYKMKLAEFRDNNIRLMKDQEATAAKLKALEGIDPEEYKTLKAEQKKLAEKGVPNAEGLGLLIQNAIGAETKPLKDMLALIEADRAKLKKDLEAGTLRDAITAVGTKKGIKAKALPYVLNKARELFAVNDGKVIAQTGVFSSAHPADPLTPDEWLDALAKTDDFLFEESKGTGASGSGPGGMPKFDGPFRTADGTVLKTDGITILP
jgi:hypothetical protein